MTIENHLQGPRKQLNGIYIPDAARIMNEEAEKKQSARNKSNKTKKLNSEEITDRIEELIKTNKQKNTARRLNRSSKTYDKDDFRLISDRHGNPITNMPSIWNNCFKFDKRLKDYNFATTFDLFEYFSLFKNKNGKIDIDSIYSQNKIQNSKTYVFSNPIFYFDEDIVLICTEQDKPHKIQPATTFVGKTYFEENIGESLLVKINRYGIKRVSEDKKHLKDIKFYMTDKVSLYPGDFIYFTFEDNKITVSLGGTKSAYAIGVKRK